MKIILSKEVPLGKRKLKFTLEHQSENKDTTTLSDALRGTAPTMLPLSSFRRVTGTMAAKEAATFLTPYDDPTDNILEQTKRKLEGFKSNISAFKRAVPAIGTRNFIPTWRRNYTAMTAAPVSLAEQLQAYKAGVQPYAGRTGETARSVGQWTGRALHGLSDPNHPARNMSIGALLGLLGGYGANRLTRSKHPVLYSALGAGLGAYLNAKSLQATAQGTPWFNTTGEDREQLLDAITKKTSSASILGGDVHGSLARLVSHTASLDEATKQALIQAIQKKPEWELLSILQQLKGGLTGGGIVALLASLLLGKRAAPAGAAIGYLLGNLFGGRKDPLQNLNTYGRSF